METSERRLRKLEAEVAELGTDLRVLRGLVGQDPGSALNKIRYVTEKVLHGLCGSSDVSWGKMEPTLENMIGPLVAARVIPRNIAIHVRTIQTNASPGSHFQEAPLSAPHVQLAQLALIELLEWYYQRDQVTSSRPSSTQRSPVQGDPSRGPSSGGRDSAPSSVPAAFQRAARSSPVVVIAGVAVLLVALAAVGVMVLQRAPAPAVAASSAASASASVPPVAVREPQIGLKAVQAYQHPTGATGSLLDSESWWRSASEDFAQSMAQPGAPPRWRAGKDFSDGEAALTRGESDAAIQAFEAAGRDDPTWALPHAALASALTDTKRYDDALAAAREAERLDPTWAFAVARLGAVYAAMGRMDDSIQELRRAVSLAPGDGVLLGHLALALHAAHLDSEADRTAKQALEADPDLVPVEVLLAERALERSDGNEALTQATRAAALAPHNAEARLAEGDALALLGRKPEAMLAYAEALESWRVRGALGAPEERLKLVKLAVDKDQLPPPRVAKDGRSLPARSVPPPRSKPIGIQRNADF